MAVLEYKADLLHQLLCPYVPHIHPADTYASLVHIKKPWNQADQSGLTASGGPYHSCGGSLRYSKGHMLQGIYTVLVIGK